MDKTISIPRVGDFWEFHPRRGVKHKTKKEIKEIFWKPSKVTGRICPWIRWRHTPKARYIGSMRVKYFLEFCAIRKIKSTK